MKYLALVFLWLGIVLGVHAEVYKHVDNKGRVTYSNKPAPGAKKLELGPANVIPTARPEASAISSNEASQQEEADERRRQLEEQMAAEEDLLSSARKALEEARQDPEMGGQVPVLGGAGQVITATNAQGQPVVVTRQGRRAAVYDEKIRALEEQVMQHEKNIAALQSELTRLNK
jgi:hypothetical protein